MIIPESNRGIAEPFNEAFDRGDLKAAWRTTAKIMAAKKGVLACGSVGTDYDQLPDARPTALNSVVEVGWIVVVKSTVRQQKAA